MSSTPTPSNPSAQQQPQLPAFFQSGASPPLIIGFIAVGAFTFGIVVLALWRRTHPRAALAHAARPIRPEETPRKPHLHDAWVLWDRGDGLSDFRWANMMPVAAKVEKTTTLPDRRPRPKIRTRLERLCIRRGHTSGADEDDDEHDVTLERAGRLEIAVLLAMPSPHRAKRQEAGVRIDETGPDDIEYSLGTISVA